jgi:putative DNA primase/helicase
MTAAGSVSRRTVYEVRTAEGCLTAKHYRLDNPDGTKQVWWEKDGKSGLNGTPLADLPLYGSELVSDLGEDEIVVLVEGEKARDALEDAGIPAVGTVTGAGGTPGREALEVLWGHEVVLWPDTDEAGIKHMNRVAEQLRGIADLIRVYTWHDAPIVTNEDGKAKSQDAADHLAVQSRNAKAVDRLLNDLVCAPAWRPEEHDGEAPETDEWEDTAPLPDGLPSVLPFDPAMLPGPLRAWVLDIAERMQVPLDYCASGAVVIAASLIGRKVGIRPKRYDDWLVIPNLWGAVVGPPAALKSPALAEIMKPLDLLVAKARETHEKALDEYEAEAAAVEAEKAALKDEIKRAAKASVKNGDRSELDKLIERQRNTETPKPPTMRRYKTNDPTVEKLAELLGENPRGLLAYRDELTGWLRSLDRQGREVDRAFYLEAWNGLGAFEIDRIGRGSSYIPALCVSILGGIQPGPLSSYVYEVARGGRGDDGLLQRFQLLVWPDPPKGPWRNVDRCPDGEAKNRAYAVYEALDALDPEKLGAAAEHEGGIPAVGFSPEAQEDFDVWRDELEAVVRDEDLSPALRNHLAKYRSLMPSLALVFHLMDHVNDSLRGEDATVVSVEAAQRAAAWCEYLRTHAERLYGSAESPALEWARALLLRIRKGDVGDGATIREVYRKQWSKLSTSEEVNAAATTLEDYGWLRVEKVETGGRPTARLRLHPSLRNDWEGGM